MATGQQSNGPTGRMSGPRSPEALVAIAGDVNRLDHTPVVWRQTATLAPFAIAASEARQTARRFTICRNHGSNFSNKGECQHHFGHL